MSRSIVFLHGFTHTGASWEPVVSALGERYSAVTPDIRGHGSAAGAEPASLQAVLGDIATSAPPDFTLAGYSMGGRIALHAALALPARIDRLVLIGASPGIADRDARERRRADDERLADEIERSSIERFADRWATTTTVLAGQPASVREAVRRDRLRNTPGGLSRALRGLGTGALPPLWDRLGELAMPVALIVGERDSKFTEIARRMADEMPSAQVVIIPGAGHAVHLEAPEAVAEVIAGG